MKMTNDDEKELHSMHHLLNEVGLTCFDSKFLERYSELFAKSLEGKGNDNYHAPTDP